MTTIHALMVGAGSGSRFGASLPKQYLPVLGRTILEHTASRLTHPAICDLTIVIAEHDTLAKTLHFDIDKPIYFTTGGAERFLSVRAGVASIRKRGGCDDDWVLIHDGARPCLPRQDLDRLIEAVASCDGVGVILASPVVDTLKFAQQGKILHTVSREHLYHAQTPQVFRLKALELMLDTVITQGLLITDEASGFEHLGEQVALVTGSPTNMKLTYPSDVYLIEQLLKAIQ